MTKTSPAPGARLGLGRLNSERPTGPTGWSKRNPMITFCDCMEPTHSGEWIPARCYEPNGYVQAPQPGGQRVDLELCETCGHGILGTQITHDDDGLI